MTQDWREFCEKNNGKINIYGAGIYGKELAIWLKEHGLNFCNFIVTKEKDKSEIFGKLVKTIAEIDEKSGSAFVIAANSKNAIQMTAELEKRGINNYSIFSDGDVEKVKSENRYSGSYISDSFVNVLFYHRVINLPTDPQQLAVSVENFEEQVRYIKENYNVVRFEDDWTCLKDKSIVLTFDDGYADNYWNALPILEKYEVPATIFVSSGNLGTANEMWWDALESLLLLPSQLPEKIVVGTEKLAFDSEDNRYKSYLCAHRIMKAMSSENREKEIRRLARIIKPNDFPRAYFRLVDQEELRKLAESKYITIGAHTVTHSSLACESEEKQRWEIRESKKRLEDIIGKEITVFSYPFGTKADYTDDTCEILKEEKIKKAGIVKQGLWRDGIDEYQIPRNIVRNWNANELARQINRTWAIWG